MAAQKTYYFRPRGTWTNKVVGQMLNELCMGDVVAVSLKNGRTHRCWAVDGDIMIDIEQARRDGRGSGADLFFRVFDRDKNDRFRDITAVVGKWNLVKRPAAA